MVKEFLETSRRRCIGFEKQQMKETSTRNVLSCLWWVQINFQYSVPLVGGAVGLE
jgi:hypothetical protein